MQQQAPAVRGKPPSILATNGLSLLGTTASLSQNPFDKVPRLPNGGMARKDSAANQRKSAAGTNSTKPTDTDRSFYPTPSANQPFDLALEDFLSPA